MAELHRTPQSEQDLRSIWLALRALVQSPYLVLYRFDAAADRVEIVRVVHGVRDLSSLF